MQLQTNPALQCCEKNAKVLAASACPVVQGVPRQLDPLDIPAHDFNAELKGKLSNNSDYQLGAACEERIA